MQTLPNPPHLEQDDIVQRFLTSKQARIPRHVVGVLMVLILTVVPRITDKHEGVYDYVYSLVFFAGILSLAYLNMYVLIPRTFYQKRYFRYLLSLALSTWGVLGIMMLINKLFIDEHLLGPKPEYNVLLGSALFTLILVPFFLISTSLKLFQRWVADTNRINSLENTALQSELKALRNQVNPHFLFNMLNSIYVLIRKDPEIASQLTLKLSDFLRYLLHEGSQATVFLSAELKFIGDLLELEKMRRDSFEFTLDYNRGAIRGIKIPSHLLITLVENAIKHSQDATGASYIRIIIELDDTTLRFSCSNTVPAILPRQAQPGGLGLTNLCRRLELLYQQRALLTNSIVHNLYVAELTLPL